MKKRYVLAIDQSTQSTKGLLLDESGQLYFSKGKPHRQLINDMGWVGHDAMEIASNIKGVVHEVIKESSIDPGDIAAVAVTNQRESVAVWERSTGRPVCESIVWQCNRAADLCDRIEARGGFKHIQQRTGLAPSPFFSAAKVAWVLENHPDSLEKARRGEICIGTMDCWTVWQLTGGKSHKTDYSNASLTQLLNINTMTWDEEVCRIFGIPMSVLPELCDSNGNYGETDLFGLLERPVPVCGVIGDSMGVLFAHGCYTPGSCMAGHGTGTCVMMNIGEDITISPNLSTSVAWRMDGKTVYEMEGVVNYAGAVITWLKDGLGLISTPDETEALSYAANKKDQTYLVPAFTGIGAPYWKNDALASFIGMSRLTGRAELVRAGVESIGYQVAAIVRTMVSDTGMTPVEIRMAGGPTKNRYLMQFQSDIMNVPVVLGKYDELAGMGAGQIAGIRIGMYDPEDLERRREKQYFYPSMSGEERRRKMDGWDRAVRAVLNY